MVRLIRAELLKLRTTQVWFWLLLAALAISALVVVGTLVSDDVHNSTDLGDMISSSYLASFAVFVLGVLGVTTEFRYQTITTTVLATPSRWAIVSAKMVAYAMVGAVYGLACLLLQVLMTVPWLATKHVDYSLGESHVRHAMLAVFLVVALYGIVGLGIGALLRNQIVAVTVGVLFLLVLQNILLAIPGVKHAYPYLPGGATTSILASSDAANSDPNGVHLLGVGGGIVVMLLWAFVPAIIGAAVTMNRDIT